MHSTLHGLALRSTATRHLSTAACTFVRRHATPVPNGRPSHHFTHMHCQMASSAASWKALSSRDQRNVRHPSRDLSPLRQALSSARNCHDPSMESPRFRGGVSPFLEEEWARPNARPNFLPVGTRCPNDRQHPCKQSTSPQLQRRATPRLASPHAPETSTCLLQKSVPLS